MADSGTIPFTIVDGTVKIMGNIGWSKADSNAVFCAKLTKAYSSTNNANQFRGNNQEQMRLGVDGTWTAGVLAAGARTSGQGASYAEDHWVENNDFAGAQTANLTKAAKSDAYALTLEAYGNGTTTASFSLAIQWNLPVWVNDGETLKQVEKAYYNDNGTIKECAVYYNDNGTIKEIV